MQNSIRRLITLTIATVLASVFGTTSFAAVISAAGGPLLQVNTRSSTDLISTNSTSFVNLPGAAVKIIIPTTGGSRLVVARFSAESSCIPTSDESCLMRIIAVNTDTTALTELHPQAGTDFVFDERGTRKSPSFERSLRLNPGTYLIRVQWAVSSATALFNLDDWHLTVSQYD